MRVMAGNTIKPVEPGRIPIPQPAGATVHTGLPIPIGGSMTASAEGRAVAKAHLPSIPCLEEFEILFVMAVETVVVPVVRAMPHHNRIVFLGTDQCVVRIEAQRRRLVFLVAGITVKIRKIGAGSLHLGIGLTNWCRIRD